MGAVYCAVQKSLDRTVALKILSRELSKDAAFCAGFEAEAKAIQDKADAERRKADELKAEADRLARAPGKGIDWHRGRRISRPGPGR